MKQLTIEVKQVENIKQKMVKYLIISDGKEKIIINVGDKTYNGVKKMQGQQQ